MAISNDPSILIIGAGLGGLMTALELHRHGFRNIQIVERMGEHVNLLAGDGFTLYASAMSTFHLYPDMAAEFESNQSTADSMSILGFEGTRLYGPVDAEWNAPGAVHAAKVRLPRAFSRPRFYKTVLDGVERRKIAIEWGNSAREYGEDEERGVAWVVFQDGTKREADIVIAADGVGTKSHNAVTGKQVDAFSSGYACLRAAMPTDIALQSKIVRDGIGWKKGDLPEFRIYMAPDQHLIVVLWDDFVICNLTHKDDGNAKESWNSSTVPSSVFAQTMEEVPGWSPVLKELVKQIPEGTLIDWKLMWRDPQPKWTSDGGRIVQIGDSAHSFLPTSVNGATQAIEDAISLASCLAKAGKVDFPKATKVHNLLRYERVSTMQKLGFVRRQNLHHFFDEDGKVNEKIDLEAVMNAGKWTWSHAPAAYAELNYDKALSHLEKGTPFENTNIPKGYKFEPWTIKAEMVKEEAGIMSELGGDWS